MLFQKKLDRAMDWLKDKSINEVENEENIEIEKSDLPALFISALLVFGPIILILFLILLWTVK